MPVRSATPNREKVEPEKMNTLQNIAEFVFEASVFLIFAWLLSAVIMTLLMVAKFGQDSPDNRLERELRQVQMELWRHEIFRAPSYLLNNSAKPWKQKRQDFRDERDRLEGLVEAFEKK